MGSAKHVLVIAAIALGVTFLYHQGIIPGLGDAKKIKA